MPNRVDIKQGYSRETIRFDSGIKYVHLPYVDVVLKNPKLSEPEATTGRFMLDTGATVSIINNRYADLVRTMTPFDHMDIRYGGGRPFRCPMYKVTVIIKGYAFDIPVVFDEKANFLLLGHFGFMEYNTFTNFDSSAKRIHIVRA